MSEMSEAKQYLLLGGALPDLRSATIAQLIMLRMEVGDYARDVVHQLPDDLLLELSDFMVELSWLIDFKTQLYG